MELYWEIRSEMYWDLMMALPSINIEEDKNSIVRYIIHDVSQKRRMSNLPMAFSMELCLDLLMKSAMFCYRKIEVSN